MMTGTSRALAISSSRFQLRTWAWRSSSSGADQLNTGTREEMRTPVSLTAWLTSVIIASSALGYRCQKNQSGRGDSSRYS